MSLDACLEEIKKVLPAATEDVEAGNFQTLPARRGRKRAAEERLKQLKEQYFREISKTALFVIVTGSLAEDFAAKAEESFSGFTSNPEAFYADLAARICPALYHGKPTVSNLFDVLGRHLEDKMNELGVLAYNQLIMKATYARTINDRDDFQALVKESINEQIGAEIVGIQAARAVVDKAIAREHKGNTTLMLLPTQDEKLIRELVRDLAKLTPNVFLVVAGKATKAVKETAGGLACKNISQENLEVIFKTIKNLKISK